VDKLVGERAWLANLLWVNLIGQTGIGELALDERCWYPSMTLIKMIKWSYSSGESFLHHSSASKIRFFTSVVFCHSRPWIEEW